MDIDDDFPLAVPIPNHTDECLKCNRQAQSYISPVPEVPVALIFVGCEDCKTITMHRIVNYHEHPEELRKYGIEVTQLSPEDFDKLTGPPDDPTMN